MIDAPPPIILSFDIEEHYRIEAAREYDCPEFLKEEYAVRMERSTRQILDQLAANKISATFYIVGEIAICHPRLVKDIAAQGHEIASHSWNHQRVHRFTAKTFREDLKRSKDALEQVAGQPVVGFRAPTFSVVRQTAWALDVLLEEGFAYDSSIYPVRHDRYGIPEAPRTPFWVIHNGARMLELPPVTYRYLGYNIPVGGGGYFRLFPSWLIHKGIKQVLEQNPASAMLYFHPWEFDPDQPRLPLSRLSRWRTYVGIRSNTDRLKELLARYRFQRAIDVVRNLKQQILPTFEMETNGLGLVPVG